MLIIQPGGRVDRPLVMGSWGRLPCEIKALRVNGRRPVPPPPAPSGNCCRSWSACLRFHAHPGAGSTLRTGALVAVTAARSLERPAEVGQHPERQQVDAEERLDAGHRAHPAGGAQHVLRVLTSSHRKPPLRRSRQGLCPPVDAMRADFAVLPGRFPVQCQPRQLWILRNIQRFRKGWRVLSR
jgi:hypothetical protein